MRQHLIAGIAAITLSLATGGTGFADDIPYFDNPYLKGGGTPSGYSAYSLHTKEGNAQPRINAVGPLSRETKAPNSHSVDTLRPGTGKFEGGTNTPCIGKTGFGSSNVIPGRGC